MNIVSKNIDLKLFWAKSKHTAKNIIYRNVQSLTRGVFRDNDWRYVNRIWNKLKDIGLDVIVEVKNGGYFDDKQTGKVSGKRYDFKLSYTNIQGKQFQFQGQLVCSFCGSVKDPTQAYDISFIVY